jgi:predicted Zn-dependent protease with MMP-like domain
MGVSVSEEEFEGFVMDALDAIPERFADELVNIAFFVEDEPPEDEPADTLGLYDGLSIDERADGYGYPGDFPDSITIFKGPHERRASSREELAHEVYVTVIHEVGHFFGMDEDQVEAMGYA